MLTAIDDGENAQTDRKKWIGIGLSCFSLNRDGENDKSAAI